MKVLVVGGGGREHAICWKLSQSPKVTELYCAPGNGGIAQIATCVPIKATDIDAMVACAKDHAIDLVVVAPDDPLALGMVDALEAAGIPAFGPRKNAAIIEASKAFSKELMKKYNIPTAKYETFSDIASAKGYLMNNDCWPIVVKADGLALGKGVEICATRQEALAAVEEMMVEGKFGASGNTVVIEEFLTGPEVSVLAFTDGETIVPMVSSMDHKRAFDGNLGPNTGGMGTIAPNPEYTPWVADGCMERIFLPTIAAMKAEGRPFQGCLYFGLMITPLGPKVIEYNCRFGDPETQVVLPLLENDLLDIMLACRNGTLDQLDIRWRNEAACCVVLASGGYPGSYQTGYPITGLEAAEKTAVIFHAGTKTNDAGQLCTAGGRVLGVTATGKDLETAINAAYAAASHIHFQNVHFRTDIGRA